MKKVMIVMFGLLMVSTMAFAEATFDQMQELIKQQNYSAAIKGLELIIQNHPKSAKAYYAMSQAQAGIGNQVKAKEALDIATGIDPTLKFASSGNVEKLKEAIQPQTNKIQAIESHGVRNTLLVLLLLGGGIGVYFFFRKKKEDVIDYTLGKPSFNHKPVPLTPQTNDSPMHKSYDEPNYSPVSAPYAPVAPTRTYTAPVAPVAHTTVINNGNDGLLTGVLVGSMLNSGNHNHNHHDTVVHERVVERETVREVPTQAKFEPVEEKSSSWDAPETKSSSWDAPETKSSSWDSGSSSSSSSWDSGSSSSSSSSSWDSGSSSSYDSGSSSSSWD
jgi:uncharacterized membrane protein YgcG